jgi:hypothetical protein
MSVCPVYQTTFQEADVARGRVALLESVDGGDIGWSDRLEEILSCAGPAPRFAPARFKPLDLSNGVGSACLKLERGVGPAILC